MKKIGAEYDQSFVFRSYNANIQPLTSWIDDLIQMTESTLSTTSYPSTELLVQSIKRYDTIFCELIRCNMIFSEQNSKLFGKSWNGVFSLLNYVIKTYHRYVKHTMHLQTQAQQLLNERLAQMAAIKVREEEFELERTALKAKIRNLEAEIESLQFSNRSLGRENTKSRLLINTYIKNENLKDDVWSLIEDLASHKEVVDPLDADNIYDEETKNSSSSNHKASIGFKRKDVIDIGHQHHRSLCRLEVEMNHILSTVIQEENRQLLVVRDLERLMSQHQDIFGQGHWRNDKYLPGSAMPSSTNEIAVQVDMKDESGVVEDMIDDNYDELAAMISTLPLPPKIQPTTAILADTKIRGVEYPYHIRRLMTSYPRVLRIPPIIWTCETIMAIYGYMTAIEARNQSGSYKIDLKDMHTSSVPYMTYRYFHDTQPIATNANTLIAQFVHACEYHHKSSKRVHLFANQLGMLEKDHHVIKYDCRDTRHILHIIDRCYNDLNPKQLTDHHSFTGALTGISSQQQAMRPGTSDSDHDRERERLNTSSRRNSRAPSHTTSHANSPRAPSRRGSVDPPSPSNHNSFTLKKHERAALSNIATTTPWQLKPDIYRTTAVNVAQSLFSKLLPNTGLDLLIRANSLPATTINRDCVNIDDLIELLLDAWKPIRYLLEDHAKHLFHMHCGTYRVASELQFASDIVNYGQIVPDQDAVVVQVPKSMVINLPRRPLRLLLKHLTSSSIISDMNNLSLKSPSSKEQRRQKSGFTSSSASTGPNASNSASTSSSTNTKKDSVCELLSKNNFQEIIKLVRPEMKGDIIDKYFSQGLEQAHRQVMKSLESIWVQYMDDKDTGSIRRDDINAHAVATVAAIMNRTSSEHNANKPRHSNNIASDSNQRILPTANIDMDGPIREATHRHYYLNVETGLTQWTPPYRSRTFYGHDLELDAFLSMFLHYDFLIHSPLRQAILTVSPRELWSNIDAYMKPTSSESLSHHMSSNSSSMFPAVMQMLQPDDEDLMLDFSMSNATALLPDDIKKPRRHKKLQDITSGSKLPLAITMNLKSTMESGSTLLKAKKKKPKKAVTLPASP